ncbi:hypothetical protein GGF50DRAFT_12128, partial [Schizophyllum commune]
WSGPCRVSTQFFGTLVSKFPGVDCYGVTSEKHPDIAGEMGIQVMPTFVAYKDGANIGKVTG